ncbi:MAG: FkbM family methyltransferase [Akkermansiaceae bacterium]|jgi:FkbM family methyltransferase
MNQTIKSCLAKVADYLNILRGYKFPDYFCERDRVKVLLFGIEPDVSKILKKKIKQGMTAIDIGGNVGLITRICAKRVGKNGHVWVFEPDPKTREFLNYNVRKCPNVKVSPIAISDENGKADLNIHPGSGTANSLVTFEAASHAIEVECMTLDTFLDQHPQISPDCIKIDVEGAELKVLAGMKETIKRFPSLFIIIEFCPHNLENGGYTSADYYNMLNALSLSLEIIYESGETSVINNLEDLINNLGDATYCNLLCYRKA